MLLHKAVILSRPHGPRGACVAGGFLRAAIGVAAAMVLLLPARPCQAQVAAAAVRGKPSARTATPTALVNVDEDLELYLAKARQFIKDGDHGQAIEILQAMINRPDCGFASAGEGRFVALRVLASQALGSMGPEGLRKYRELYDARAHGLYQRALEAGDVPGLRLVAERYAHSSYGPKAMEALAELYFDRGSFSQAGYFWQQAHGAAQSRDQPMLMTKAACAFYLAGQRQQADSLAAALNAEHPAAEGVLGGKGQKLVEFLQGISQMPPPQWSSPSVASKGWPGLGGFPNGAGTMEDCDATLMPCWRQPERLELPAGVALPGPANVYDSRTGQPMAVKSGMAVRGGHVELRTSSDRFNAAFRLPATISPVAVNGLVVYRDHEDVLARDVLTGQVVWSTQLSAKRPGKPMERPAPPGAGNYSVYQFRFGESGRYWVTTDGRDVYALHDFPPTLGNPSRLISLRSNPKYSRDLADTSRLMSICAASGKLNWEVGNGLGDKEFVRGCKFISAPTHHAGRLYVMATSLEQHHLLCLDARSGSLLWHAPVCQIQPNRSSSSHYLEPEQQGTPPAVAEGRAYALTNAGVIAAFDAQTGQPVWAYQYGTPSSGSVSVAGGKSGQQFSEFFPPNPVILSRGRVVCLPSDSNSLLVLAAEDGKCLTQQPRYNQRYLSYIDEDRVLLSSDGLYVYSLGRGSMLLAAADKGVLGRPAVTPRAVLACGESKVLRLALDDLELSSTGLASPDGLLGNLLTFNGTLLAANAAGVCGYSDFDRANMRLSARVSESQGRQRLQRTFERAIFAFNSRRFDLAAGDFEQCLAEAQASDDGQMLQRLHPWMYRLHVALANSSRTSQAMLQALRRAQDFADSDQDKAHLLVRLAKCHELTGDLEAALEAASELARQYGQENLLDVGVGPAAADGSQSGEDAQRIKGSELAQALIARIVSNPAGRKAYAPVDAQARQALDAACAAGDSEAMAEVARRWPHSLWAGQALLTAAETEFIKAKGLRGAEARSAFDAAERNLAELADSPDADLRTTATVGLSQVHLCRGRRTLAAMTAKGLRGREGGQEVIFADVRGRLDDLVRQATLGMAIPSEAALPALPAGKLERKYLMSHQACFAVRQHDQRPVMVGGRLLAVTGDRALLLEPSAADELSAIAWSGVMPLPGGAVVWPPASPTGGPAAVGGLTPDGKTLIAANRALLAAFEVQTSKLLWHRPMSELGVSQPATMTAGEGAVLLMDAGGTLSCVDMADGQVRWRFAGQPGGRRTSDSLILARGLVVVGRNSGRTAAMLDLASGKTVCRWSSTSAPIRLGLAGGGLILVRLVGNELSAYEVSALAAGDDEPLWTAAVPNGENLLACGYDRIALAVDGDIAVASLLAGGRSICSFPIAPSGKGAAAPIDAAFAGKDLYLAVSAGRVSPAPFGRVWAVEGLAINKYDTTGKGLLWSSELLAPQAGRQQAVWPMALGANVVAISGAAGENDPLQAWVLDARSGSLCQQLQAGTLTAGQMVQERYRLMNIGPVIISDTHLFVESYEGLAVFGQAKEASREQ